MKKLKGIDGKLDDAWSLLVKKRAGMKCEYCGKQTNLNMPRKKLIETKLVAARLNSDLVRKIEKLAEIENRNFSNMVETLLINQIEKQNEPKTITP